MNREQILETYCQRILKANSDQSRIEMQHILTELTDWLGREEKNKSTSAALVRFQRLRDYARLNARYFIFDADEWAACESLIAQLTKV